MWNPYLFWAGRDYLLFRLLSASIDLAHAKPFMCRKYALLFSSTLYSLTQNCGCFLWDIHKGINKCCLIYYSIFGPPILHSYSCFFWREAYRCAKPLPYSSFILLVSCSNWGESGVREPVAWGRYSICRQEHATLVWRATMAMQYWASLVLRNAAGINRYPSVYSSTSIYPKI